MSSLINQFNINVDNFNDLHVNETGNKHTIFANLASTCDINDEIIHVCYLTPKQRKKYSFQKPFIMSSMHINQLENEDMTEENRRNIELYKKIKAKINDGNPRKCMLIYHTMIIDDDLISGDCISRINIKMYGTSYVNWKHV